MLVNIAGAQLSDEPNQRDGQANVATTSKMPRAISSRNLLGGDRLVIIRHEREDYRLQVTSRGKLILTK